MKSFKTSLLRWVFFLAGATLVGCAGTSAVTDGSGRPIPAPTASFKLHDAEVRWVPNAGYKVDGLVGARTQAELDRSVNKANAHMEKRYLLLKTHAKEDLEKALAVKGVSKGTRQTITLMPVRGYFDQSGFGSGLIVQVMVIDRASGETWVHQVKADSGIQIAGLAGASEPDRDYVEAFASGLVRVFSESGLIK